MARASVRESGAVTGNLFAAAGNRGWEHEDDLSTVSTIKAHAIAISSYDNFIGLFLFVNAALRPHLRTGKPSGGTSLSGGPISALVADAPCPSELMPDSLKRRIRSIRQCPNDQPLAPLAVRNPERVRFIQLAYQRPAALRFQVDEPGALPYISVRARHGS
jgi:hypothetical protein